ncbi:hypothetical protein L3C95_16010 [Chitinophaga filiformis]|uniref:hypothetical protein n=1 Tax=Chitinophaga filiformis TaxID=104663 RepID=UPI001F2CDB1D|nr:hypothetical protein [Chitinophaga filiformis]MCF6404403.1 hypothetical protein [Chitinophaga filiformis]
MEGNEIARRLESDNIEEVISMMDIMVNELLFFVSRSLYSLEKNVEWRPFIAERIYKLIDRSKCAIDDMYQKRDGSDNDLRFWLNSLLVMFDQNEDFILSIFNHVANNEDDNEIIGLNILVRRKAVNTEKLIIEKLRKAVFTVKNYDRNAFYLVALKTLNVDLPEDIVEKVSFYNQRVQHAWQKLDC